MIAPFFCRFRIHIVLPVKAFLNKSIAVVEVIGCTLSSHDVRIIEWIIKIRVVYQGHPNIIQCYGQQMNR